MMDFDAHPVYGLVISRILALGCALFFRQHGVSTALPLILFGAMIGSIPWAPNAPSNPELVMIIVLAPLIFGEAMNSSYIDLKKVRNSILALSVLLVILTTLAVGFTVAYLTDMPLALGFALGAILAPTDAVAIGAIAKRISLPRKLILILEGESLVNDGTGLTALHIAIIVLLAGSCTFLEMSLIFSQSILLGVGIGLASGWLLSRIVEYSKDPVAANMLVLMSPFSIYLAADSLNGSGILATVIAGMVVAHRHFSRGGYKGRSQSHVLWKHWTFMLNTEAFFLVGLETPDVLLRLSNDHRLVVAQLVPIVLLVIIATRMIFVILRRQLHLKMNKSVQPLNWQSNLIIAWAGARGPVSGLAAFSLPIAYANTEQVPYRDVIMATVFCVIIASLLLALTIAPLAKLLKITADDESAVLQTIKRRLASISLEHLHQAEKSARDEGQPLPTAWVEHIRTDLESRINQADTDDETGEHQPQKITAINQVLISMIHAERKALILLRKELGVPDGITRQLMRQLDQREHGLNSTGMK